MCDQKLHLFIQCVSAKFHEIRNLTVTFLCRLILCIKCDNLWQIHCIGCAVDDVCAIIRKRCTCLMCHGMYNAKECIGKCHTSQTLCIVHGISLFHIPVVRRDQVTLDHLNRMQRKRIGKIAVCGGNICLDRMCHCIHSSVCHQFLRHGLCQIRINNRNIRCDLKICNRILDSLLIICNDGKRSNFCCSSGS